MLFRSEPLRKANPEVPRDLQTIVAKAMDPDPSQRYDTADDLAEDLSRLLNLQPIHARRPGLLNRGVKLMRRNRMALVGAVLGVGMARGISAIDLGVVGRIFLSWIITIPAGALLSIVFFYILRFVFG